nr:PREDICTED: UDP-glucuronosyltransferase 2B9-like [Bemisia tabaci]XP_018901370.1 PREDICTED: UDP-glucuronosyltransferase 2B9-like [Bemisia tabaci]
MACIADVARKQLMSEAFLQFNRRVKSDKITFDLIIIETLYIPYACILAKEFSESAPIISMSSITTDFVAEDHLGSIMHLSFQPSRSYTNRMSLWQKLDNWVTHYYIVPELKKQMGIATRRYCKDVYGPEYESIVGGCEWQSKISLSLITSNPIYFYPRLLGPNVIEVGPLHIKQSEKLPQNLQKWLDDAKTGVIYFSLGSNVRSKSLPENVLANFLRCFRELQPQGYRVLWKWELDGEIPGQSSNILAQKWIPQESVLAHPEVKIFIMQGGLQSFQETVHYGTPIVGIPWFGDQEVNVNKIVDAEIGVRLLPSDLDSYERVKTAIGTVLFNEKYFMNMKRLSAISHDFTARGMDQAVFWVEHVAKHGGASHLRPSTADATLFEYFCLGIIAVIFLFSFLFFYFLRILLQFISSKVSKAFENKLKSS